MVGLSFQSSNLISPDGGGSAGQSGGNIVDDFWGVADVGRRGALVVKGGGNI